MEMNWRREKSNLTNDEGAGSIIHKYENSLLHSICLH